MKNKKSLFIILLFLISLCLIINCTKSTDTPIQLKGFWKGEISALGKKYAITITFKMENEIKGFIDIPEQGASQIQLSEIKYNYPSLSFTLPANPNPAVFNGKITKDGISGSFEQSGVKGTFSLSSTAADEGKINQSDDEQEIEMDTGTGILYGTLQKPENSKESPVVLIIAGSGPTDRDGNSMSLPGKNNSLKYLALELAKMNISSVRYDKRGIAKSSAAMTAGEESLRFEIYIDDAVKWIEKLKSDKQFVIVGVIGHSEGALIGMLAAKKTRVDFYVSLSGIGRPIDEILTEQLKGKLTDPLMAESQKIMKELKAGRTVADVNKDLMSLFRPSVQPYLISMFKYSPVNEIKTMKIPVLIAHGANDIQVKPGEAQLLSEANKDAALLMVSGMNHVLKAAPMDATQNINSYSDPGLPIVPELTQGINNFILQIVTAMNY